MVVETNWVVDYAAPMLARGSAARELYERARRGELRLHVPAIALVEARKVVREKTPRADVNLIREFVRGMRGLGRFSQTQADSTFEVLSKYDEHVQKEKSAAPERIRALIGDPHLSVFPLDEQMLDESVLLAASAGTELQSFDIAILSAVLVTGRRLGAEDEDVSFVTLDRDLQCWDRNGNPKPALKSLYDAARVWVYGDFLLSTPERPAAWLK